MLEVESPLEWQCAASKDREAFLPLVVSVVKVCVVASASEEASAGLLDLARQDGCVCCTGAMVDCRKADPRGKP